MLVQHANIAACPNCMRVSDIALHLTLAVYTESIKYAFLLATGDQNEDVTTQVKHE